MRKLVIAVALLFSLVVPSLAEDAPEILVERWYKALATVDRAEFADLLTDDATIVLEDQEVELNKSEFLASLTEWESAAKDTKVKHRLEGMENGRMTMLVCYEFPENTPIHVRYSASVMARSAPVPKAPSARPVKASKNKRPVRTHRPLERDRAEKRLYLPSICAPMIAIACW